MKCKTFIWKVFVVYILNILTILIENSLTPHMHICKNLPLLYSFVGDFTDDGHAKAEICKRHIVKWHMIVVNWATVGLNAI